MSLRCSDCGESVDPRDDGTLVEVVGFARGRSLTSIQFPATTGRFLCSMCVTRRKYVEPVQLSFDGRTDVPWEDAVR